MSEERQKRIEQIEAENVALKKLNDLSVIKEASVKVTEEQSKILEKLDDNTELTEEDKAAMFLYQASRDFKNIVSTLANRKKKSVGRVLEAVLFEPLERVDLLGKDEKELFAICQQIMYNKGKILKYTMDQMEKGAINGESEKK